MEQDKLEQHIQHTAQLVKFVKSKLKVPLTKEEKELDTYYPDRRKADFITSTLCSLIKGMTSDQQEQILWDAKNATSRKLADWWDEHLKADRKRIYEEMRIQREAQIKKDVMKKLTKKEKKILGLL
jgi:hypothetical protein